MPENTPVSAPAPQGQPSASPAPAPQEQPSFSMPEKFAGKSAEDIAKSYVELEKQYGSHGDRLKAYDEYSKIGTPQQVAEAIAWAREHYQKVQKGEWVERAAQKPQPQPGQLAPPGAPWEADDFAYKNPAEQAKLMHEYQQAGLRSYIDQIAGTYGQQLQGLVGRDAREKSILLRAIKTAIQNPGVDPEQILNDASQLASKSAEDLMQMVIDSHQNSPAVIQKQIDDKVAIAIAEARQKWEAEQQSEIFRQASPTPRHRLAPNTTREDENRSILQNLAKQGIRLS